MVPEVAPVSPGAEKLRVRAPITPLIERLVKVASPLALVVAVAEPPRVPPPLAMAAVTTMPACATGWLEASRSWIWGCCARTAPLCAGEDGWVARNRWGAAPGPGGTAPAGNEAAPGA